MIQSSSNVVSSPVLMYAIVVVPSLFVPICFILFYTRHAATEYTFYGIRQIPTLSKTGALAPESIVFTYGLHLESVLLAAAFLLQYHKNSIKIVELSIGGDGANDNITSASPSCCCCCLPRNLKDCPFLNLWNRILLSIGLVGCVCMSLVGSVSLDVNYSVHTAFAVLMFVCFILHMLLSYITVDNRLGRSAFKMWVHRCCLFVCIPMNLATAAISLIVVTSCGSFSCRYFYVNISPILEYLTVLSLLLYILQFKDDLHSMSVATLFAPTEIAREDLEGQTIGT
jgi:hypothetical protein